MTVDELVTTWINGNRKDAVRELLEGSNAEVAVRITEFTRQLADIGGYHSVWEVEAPILISLFKLAEGVKAGDESMGQFVYCTQHRRVHSTGWCTVPTTHKVALPEATSPEQAQHHWQLLRQDLKLYAD